MAQRGCAIRVFNTENSSRSLLLEAISVSETDTQADFARMFPERRALPWALGFTLGYLWGLFAQSISETLSERETGRIEFLW